MQTYNVHIYREMRLFFPGIVARTAEEAARLAAEMPSDAAQALEDCDGENLAALVSVVGREDAKQIRMIDLTPVRDMAPDLLTALTLALPILQEVVRAQLLSDDTTARLVMNHVLSVIAKAHEQTDLTTYTHEGRSRRNPRARVSKKRSTASAFSNPPHWRPGPQPIRSPTTRSSREACRSSSGTYKAD